MTSKITLHSPGASVGVADGVNVGSGVTVGVIVGVDVAVSSGVGVNVGGQKRLLVTSHSGVGGQGLSQSGSSLGVAVIVGVSQGSLAPGTHSSAKAGPFSERDVRMSSQLSAVNMTAPNNRYLPATRWLPGVRSSPPGVIDSPP
jgi:hypothetical protein